MNSQIRIEGFRQSGVAQEIILKAVTAMKEAGIDDVIAIFAILEQGVICPSIRLGPENEVHILRTMERHLIQARKDYGLGPGESFID